MSCEAVLAERRSKVKWSLNPRGTLWANDDNKYGQKLMEKLGWSKGQGLGRELQGDKDHISVKFKQDNKGFGYKGQDDEWIKHYEGFESVLATLNSEDNSAANSKNNSTCNSAANSDEEGKVMKSGGKKSLEMASKISRARVHYHKFIRAKDLSRYSADDIDCVLGTKRSRILAEEKVKTEIKEESAIGEEEHINGITVIKSGTIQEYFAQKFEALKNRPKMDSQIVEEKDCQDNIDEEPQRAGFGFVPTVCNRTDISLHHDDTAEVPVCKKKKKKKKHTVEDSEKNMKSGEKDDEVNDMGGTEVNQTLIENDAELVTSKKKKRKHRECEEVRNGRDVIEEVPDERGGMVGTEVDQTATENDVELVTSKKKKRKHREFQEVRNGRDVIVEVPDERGDMGGTEVDQTATENDAELVTCKKKKKKRKQRECEEVRNGKDVIEEVPDERSQIIKKKKTSNDCGGESSPFVEHSLDEENVSKSRKKKKKESVTTAVEEGSVEYESKATDEDFPVLIQEDKKKRKKKRGSNENGEANTQITVVEEDNVEIERKASDDDSTILKKKNKKRKKDKDRESHFADGQSTEYNEASEINCTGNGRDVKSKKSKTKKKRDTVE